MGRTVTQYCHEHKIMERYPACDNGLPAGVRNSKMAQLAPKDRPVLWTKTKEDGTLDIRFPPRRESPMLDAYKEQGFEVKEFTSYQDHQRFCKENDLVNHAAEGIK